MCSIGAIEEHGSYRRITQVYNAKTLYKVALDMLEGIRLGKVLGKDSVNHLHLSIAIEVGRQLPEETHGADMPIADYRQLIINTTEEVMETGFITEDSEDIDEIIEVFFHNKDVRKEPSKIIGAMALIMFGNDEYPIRRYFSFDPNFEPEDDDSLDCFGVPDSEIFFTCANGESELISLMKKGASLDFTVLSYSLASKIFD